jgi:hypothetical protein
MTDSAKLLSTTNTEKFLESSCNKEISNEIAKDSSSSKSTNDDATRRASKSFFDLSCPESMAAFWDDCEDYEADKKQDFFNSQNTYTKQDINTSTQSISPQLYPLVL